IDGATTRRYDSKHRILLEETRDSSGAMTFKKLRRMTRQVIRPKRLPVRVPNGRDTFLNTMSEVEYDQLKQLRGGRSRPNSRWMWKEGSLCSTVRTAFPRPYTRTTRMGTG